MKEPKRITDINSLVSYVADRVRRIMAAMEAQGYDPIIFEARRTLDRQKWLYGIGRTHSLKRKPVTWTLKSRHLVGKAVDIISKKHLWNYPKFYAALAREAKKEGMKPIQYEQCHIEFS